MKILNLLYLFSFFKYTLSNNAWILTDVQNCFENEIPIYGATLNYIDISKEINENIDIIDYIAVIKYSHNNNEINNKLNWINSTGNHPDEYQMIVDKDIGRNWWPTSVSLEYAKKYSNYLKINNKTPIMMWPSYCLSNTVGNNINNEIKKSIENWENKNNKTVVILEKGLNTLSEQYGIIPEARFPEVFRDTNITKIINEVIYILTSYNNIKIIGDEYSHSTLPVLKDFYEILYEWLKIPNEDSPNIILNDGIFNNFEIHTINLFKWLKNKFNLAINDFIEHLVIEDL